MFQKYTSILTQVFVVIFLLTNIVNTAPKKSPENECYEQIKSVFNNDVYEEDEKYRNVPKLMIGFTANYYMRLAFLKFTTDIVKNTKKPYAIAYYNFLGKSIEKAVCSPGIKGTLKDFEQWCEDFVDPNIQLTLEDIYANYSNTTNTGCCSMAATSSKKLTTEDIIKNAYYNVAFTNYQKRHRYLQKEREYFWDIYHYHTHIVESCYKIETLPTPEKYCKDSCRRKIVLP